CAPGPSIAATSSWSRRRAVSSTRRSRGWARWAASPSSRSSATCPTGRSARGRSSTTGATPDGTAERSPRWARSPSTICS
ncbi:MAG: hypothetical protein AVDCRST_MAG30-691, partial [uncultured Solirubrobacteraceae bacterium]